MRNKMLGLGDFFQEVLSNMNLVIRDEELLASLNQTKLTATPGLQILYTKTKELEPLGIPMVNSQDILEDVEKKEAKFLEFWNKYNKKTGQIKAKPRFLKLTWKEIDAIFATLPHYLKATPDVKFRKDPFTYLNQRTWEDEMYLPKAQEAKKNIVFRFD